MAFQPETDGWESGIYQLEVADPVRGGAGGVDNLPLLQLANRTGYLKAICDTLTGEFAGLAPINGPAFTGTPTAPTAAASNNSLSIANTAFVQRANSGTTALTGLTGGTIALTADQAALPNLTLAGTLTSNLVITVPPAQVGLMRVTNNTTGAFTVTVKTTGGSGIVVAQGTATFVFNDGTNVVDGFTGAGGASFSGTVTVANNTSISAKDTTGVARRLAVLAASANVFLGDVDNAITGSTLHLAGQAAITAEVNAGVVATFNSTGLGVGTAPSFRVHAYVAAANSEIRAAAGTAGDAIVSAEAVGVMIGQLAMRRATGLLELNVGGTATATFKNDGTATIGNVTRNEALNVAGNAYLLRSGGASMKLVDQYSNVLITSVPDAAVTASHMDFYTSGVFAARLDNTGRFGIGVVPSGANKLQVNGTAAATLFSGPLTGNVTGNVTGNASTATLASKASTLAAGGGNGTAMTFSYAGQAGQPAWLWGTNDGVTVQVYSPSNFNVNSATTAGSATSAGTATTASNVINNSGRTDAAAYPVLWAPAGGGGGEPTFSCAAVTITSSTGQLAASSLYASGDITAFSDVRVKTNIETITNALAKVRAMRGVTYTRTDEPHVGLRQAGLIAQEVQAVMDEFVKVGADGMLSVAYGNIVSVLIEAVKELADKFDEREAVQ